MSRRGSPGALPLVLAALGALAAGCEELDDPSEVKDLRLLAVALDPPELLLDPAQPEAELPEIAVWPLVADPAGNGRALEWAVRACANDPAAPSAPGAGTEAAANYPGGGARSTVGSARCPPDGPTSVALTPRRPFTGGPVSVRLPRGLVTAALASDLFPGHLGRLHGGFDLGLPINLELEVRAGDETVVGLKRVIIWPAPLGPEHRPNRNPVTTRLRSFRERHPTTLEPQAPITEMVDPVLVAVQAGHPLWIEPVGAEAEPYLTTVVDRLTDEAKVVAVPAENLRFSFFATAGKFVPAETTSTLPFGAVATARVPTEARYEPPAASELPLDQASGQRSLRVTIWVVTRDERGGASFLERTLLVSESAL
jgi:hypothetical protein